MLFLGEAARITHNATGEGIFQAMQSGIYAADAIADVLGGKAEQEAWRHYTWQCRRRFTAGFVVGHILRGAIKTPLLDGVALAYNSPLRKLATWAVSFSLSGSNLKEEMAPPVQPAKPAAPAQPQRSRPTAAVN
jgi:flavin-dependent dehydrogenase